MECKEKWKNLRTALTRAKKKLPSGSGASNKKYYLEDAMAFLLPFIKSRKQSGNLPSPTPRDELNDEPMLESEMSNTSKSSQENCSKKQIGQDSADQQDTHELPEKDVSQNYSQWNVTTEEQTQNNTSLPIRHKRFNSTQNKRICSRPSTSTLAEDADACFIDFVKKQTAPTMPNADLEFLQSLLPDVTKMDCKRKRRFKIGVLQLIDTLLQEKETEELTPLAVSCGAPSPALSSAPSVYDSSTRSTSPSAAEYFATWNIP